MTHYFPVTIFYEDTDAGGVVYHANYVKYMERARTIFLRDKGFNLPDLMRDLGVQFLVRSLNIEFYQPARLQQEVIVVTKITKLGKASLNFNQTLFFDPANAETMICSGEVGIVCTNLQFKPCAMPAAMRREMKSEN